MNRLGFFLPKAVERAAEGKEIYKAVINPGLTLNEQVECHEKYFSDYKPADGAAFICDIEGRFGLVGEYITIKVMGEFFRIQIQERLYNKLLLAETFQDLQLLMELDKKFFKKTHENDCETLEKTASQIANRLSEHFNEQSETEIQVFGSLVDKLDEGSEARKLFSAIYQALSSHYSKWREQQEEEQLQRESQKQAEEQVIRESQEQAEEQEKLRLERNQKLKEQLLEVIARPQIQDVTILNQYDLIFEEINQNHQDWQKLNWIVDRIQFRISTSLLSSLAANMRDLSLAARESEKTAKQQEQNNQDLVKAVERLAEQGESLNEVVGNLERCLETLIEQQCQLLKLVIPSGNNDRVAPVNRQSRRQFTKKRR